MQDLAATPKYLVTFTVGYNQKNNIDAAIRKVSFPSFLPSSLSLSLAFSFFSIKLYFQFSDNFTIVLFHYDGRITEWDEFEWSKRAIHVSAAKQTKWLDFSPF